MRPANGMTQMNCHGDRRVQHVSTYKLKVFFRDNKLGNFKYIALIYNYKMHKIINKIKIQ